MLPTKKQETLLGKSLLEYFSSIQSIGALDKVRKARKAIQISQIQINYK